MKSNKIDITEEIKKINSVKYHSAISEKDFSRFNCTLNNQERFKSIYCFSFPLFLQFEITNLCNLNCIECGVVNKPKSTLPKELFHKLWILFPYIGGIAWLGGETFLVDYFLDLLQDINYNFPHLDHTIYTNGTLLGDERIASVLASINKLQLKFSVDSVVKETYEKIRRLGTFELVIKSLLKINEVYARKNKKPNIGINVVVMKSNLEQLILYPDFCKKYGINHLDISFLADVYPPSLGEENIFVDLNEEFLRYIKNILLNVEAKCKEYGIRLYCNFNTTLKEKDNILDKVDLRKIYNQIVKEDNLKENIDYNFYCYYPWTSLFIKCNGLVVPTGDCIIPVGNILEDDFFDIWNGPYMQIYRYKLINSDISNWCAYHCQQKLKVCKKLVSIK